MKSNLILVYNLFIRMYVFAIRLAAIRNKKAKEWLRGRRNLFEELKSKLAQNEKTIWVHCASAGELEQGKPVIEKLKTEFPSHKIVLSFFSPSGYAAGKKYGTADIITYLPLDTKKNAKRFIEIVKPELAVFVKYEYWYHHLATAAFHHIPLLLVSSIFRKEQVFFKWYGKFFRQMLFLFRQIFVQDEASLQLLKANGIEHVTIGGDTRFDRVVKIASGFSTIDVLEDFTASAKVLVAGSTWPNDEQLLADFLKTTNLKLVVAPHEINESHIASIKKKFPGCITFSAAKNSLYQKVENKLSVWNSIDEQQTVDLQKKLSDAKVLVMDNYGMLSKLYRYATITYIGGGFNKSGIHNTLEAAVWNKPVFFGLNYKKFREARELIENGAAFSISTAEELKTRTENLLNKENELQIASDAAGNYVIKNTGATQTIIKWIQEKRLLTKS